MCGEAASLEKALSFLQLFVRATPLSMQPMAHAGAGAGYATHDSCTAPMMSMIQHATLQAEWHSNAKPDLRNGGR